jgi:DNA-binding transcriptional LysR family regulator
MMPSSQDLQYFLEVAKQGNVSRAATRLTVSQPTLSMSLKRLETSLGTELFVRFKTGVSLTAEGQRFVTEAQALLDQWERIRHFASSGAESLAGHFRIGVHVSVALYALPEIAPRLNRALPRVEISWVHDLSRNLVQKVLDNELDIALAINPVSHPDLVLLPLAKDKVGFWKHADLEDSDTLIYDPNLHQAQDLIKRLKKSRTEAFTRHMTSTSLEVIRTLALARTGVGILPERVALAAGDKKLVRLAKAPVYEDSLGLIYRAHQRRNRAFCELKTLIKESKI